MRPRRKRHYYGIIAYLHFAYRCYIFFLVASLGVTTLVHPVAAATSTATSTADARAPIQQPPRPLVKHPSSGNALKTRTVDLRSLVNSGKSFWFPPPPSSAAPSSTKDVISSQPRTDKNVDPYKSLLGWVFRLTNRSMHTLASYLMPKQNDDPQQNKADDDDDPGAQVLQQEVKNVPKESRREKKSQTRAKASTTSEKPTDQKLVDKIDDNYYTPLEKDSMEWNGGPLVETVPFWDRRIYTKYWIPPRPAVQETNALRYNKQPVQQAAVVSKTEDGSSSSKKKAGRKQPGSQARAESRSPGAGEERRKPKKSVKPAMHFSNRTLVQQRQPSPKQNQVQQQSNNWYSSQWPAASTRKGNLVSFLLPFAPPMLYGMSPSTSSSSTFSRHKETPDSPLPPRNRNKKVTIAAATPRPLNVENEDDDDDDILLTPSEKKKFFTILEKALWETFWMRNQALAAWHEKYNEFKEQGGNGGGGNGEDKQSPEQFIINDLFAFAQNNRQKQQQNKMMTIKPPSNDKIVSASKVLVANKFNEDRGIGVDKNNKNNELRIPDNEKAIVQNLLENFAKSRRARDTRRITKNVLIPNPNMTDLLASPSTFSVKTTADFLFSQARKPTHVALQHQGSLGILPNPVLKSQLQKFMAMRQQVERNKQKNGHFTNGHSQGDRKKHVMNSRNQFLNFGGGHNIQSSPFQTSSFNRGSLFPGTNHHNQRTFPRPNGDNRVFQHRPPTNTFRHRPDGPSVQNRPNPSIDSTLHAHVSNARPINNDHEERDRFKIISTVGQTQVDGPWTFIGQTPTQVFQTNDGLEEMEVSPPIPNFRPQKDGQFVEFHFIPHDEHFGPNVPTPPKDHERPPWWNHTTTQSTWLTVSDDRRTQEPPKQSVSFVESSMKTQPGSEIIMFTSDMSDHPHKSTIRFQNGTIRPRLKIITRKPLNPMAFDHGREPIRPVPMDEIPHNFNRPGGMVQHAVTSHDQREHEANRFHHTANTFRPSNPVREEGDIKHFSTVRPNFNQETSNQFQNQFTDNRFIPHNFNDPNNEEFRVTTQQPVHNSPRPTDFIDPETRPRPLDITMKPHTDIVPERPFFHRPTLPSTVNGNRFTHNNNFGKDNQFDMPSTEGPRRPQSFSHSHFQSQERPVNNHFDSDSNSNANRFPVSEFNDEDDEELHGFTVKPDPAIIPPRPPFLPDMRGPMYFVPTEKQVPQTTASTTKQPPTNPGVVFHPHDFTNSRRPNQPQQTNTLHTPSGNFHSEMTTERSSFEDGFHSPDFPFQVITKSTSQRGQHHIPTAKTTFSTTKPNHMPIPKFLTPLVNFRDPVTENSLVSHGAVTVTPIAIATPEFIPKPPVQSRPPEHSTPFFDDFGSSEKKAEEEYDTLFTPFTSKPPTTFAPNFPFQKVIPNDHGLSTTFRNDAPQTLDDDDDFTKVTKTHSTKFGSTHETNFVSSTSSFEEDTFTNKFHQTIGSSSFTPFQAVQDVDVFGNNFKSTLSSTGPNRFPTDHKPPLVGSLATPCDPSTCQLPECFCGGNNRIPGDLSTNEVPQLVMLTFDDDVNEVNWPTYKKLLYSGRQNPNGCPIQATFYVSHEWTDYSKVQTLYADGHEIASHSISHPDGAKFSKQRWTDEIQGQREVLNYLGGIPAHDVRGMRAPFLAVGGNKMFSMLYDSNFTYDSSLPVPMHDPPMWPYTLDFALNHDCMIPPCPRNSYPGVWEIPMVMWVDLKGGRCSMADACQWPNTKEEVFQTLLKNFKRHYTSNRAPFNLFFHSAWFGKRHNLDGFQLFVDRVLTRPDVYFVTSSQVIEWMRRPTPLREIHGFVPFACHLRTQHAARCKKPHECQLRFRSETRYVRTCQECPEVYPWVKNPFGEAPINSSNS